ncbi:hypothetical protein ACIQXU_16470 [Peribacillus sp. NPDC097284]|uniref:hypothetical protein n=1 Tax=Peribacillus sp. NPDC097284 TaxID=3364401 RepID=UPI00381221C9
MKEIGRRIYFDNLNGSVIVDTGQKIDSHSVPIDREIQSFTALSERNRNTFDVLELPYGAYLQDFAECGGNYRVNPTTKELEFSYPVPGEPEAPQVFGPPLTEQIEELKAENTLLKARNQAISERTDFHEDLIADMAMMIYQ